MTNWYQLGYSMLFAALELTPQLAENSQQASQSLDQLLPGVFPIEGPFAEDRLTRWFLLKLHARLCKMHGKKFRGLKSTIQAWWITN